MAWRCIKSKPVTSGVPNARIINVLVLESVDGKSDFVLRRRFSGVLVACPFLLILKRYKYI